MGEELRTEKVSWQVEVRHGEVETEEFWIAYPDDVLALGRMEDRISRAWGAGPTEAAAIADAEAAAEQEKEAGE